MADRTLYDILEVSEKASAETIRAAWIRLSAKWDPDSSENAANPEARTQFAAVKDAYLTLATPQKRAAYDNKLNAQWHVTVETVSSKRPYVVIALLALLAGGGYYHHTKQEQARIAAEKAIAIAKAKEAEEKRKAEIELAELENQRQRQEKLIEQRQRAERDASLQRYQFENRFDDTRSMIKGDRTQIIRERERRMQERAEDRVRREEQREAHAAQQHLAREKAALCQMERARYGRAISCPY